MEELILDAEFVGPEANRDFLQNPEFKYNMQKLTQRIQAAYNDLGLIKGTYPLEAANWDTAELAAQ